jgi:FkbM family methyltransferase
LEFSSDANGAQPACREIAHTLNPSAPGITGGRGHFRKNKLLDRITIHYIYDDGSLRLLLRLSPAVNVRIEDLNGGEYKLPIPADGRGYRLFREMVVGAIASQPVRVKEWLLHRHPRALLGLLFRLERGDIVVSHAGPPGARFLMKMKWQSNTEYVLGTYEPGFLGALRKHIRRGDTCVDVGGHIGYYSFLMAKFTGPEGRVITFEPVAENLAALRENTLLNKAKNIRVVETALGERVGVMKLVRAENETVSATPSMRGYAVEGKRIEVEVRVDTLDAFLARETMRPSVIKIDVEGAEIDVLRGATETLRTIRPTVLLEIHGWGDSISRQVTDLLVSANYLVSLAGRLGREAFCVAVPDGKAAAKRPSG